MASTEVNERQRLTQTWRTLPSTAPFYTVKNMSFKRYRNAIYLPALMQDLLIVSFHWSYAEENGSKSCLRGSAALSRAGRRYIMGPCVNMGQSEMQGGGLQNKKIRQPVVHRVQPEFKTLKSASKIFPMDYYRKDCESIPCPFNHILIQWLHPSTFNPYHNGFLIFQTSSIYV